MGPCLGDTVTSGIDFWQDLGLFLKPLPQVGKIIKWRHTIKQIVVLFQ